MRVRARERERERAIEREESSLFSRNINFEEQKSIFKRGGGGYDLSRKYTPVVIFNIFGTRNCTLYAKISITQRYVFSNNFKLKKSKFKEL